MDAAQDLGCTPMQGFFKVVFPELLPGIVSGAIMSFTMSLDDFVISYFAYGPRFATLPVEDVYKRQAMGRARSATPRQEAAAAGGQLLTCSRPFRFEGRAFKTT